MAIAVAVAVAIAVALAVAVVVAFWCVLLLLLLLLRLPPPCAARVVSLHPPDPFFPVYHPITVSIEGVEGQPSGAC